MEIATPLQTKMFNLATICTFRILLPLPLSKTIQAKLFHIMETDWEMFHFTNSRRLEPSRHNSIRSRRLPEPAMRRWLRQPQSLVRRPRKLRVS